MSSQCDEMYIASHDRCSCCQHCNMWVETINTRPVKVLTEKSRKKKLYTDLHYVVFIILHLDMVSRPMQTITGFFELKWFSIFNLYPKVARKQHRMVSVHCRASYPDLWFLFVILLRSSCLHFILSQTDDIKKIYIYRESNIKQR